MSNLLENLQAAIRLHIAALKFRHTGSNLKKINVPIIEYRHHMYLC